MAYQRVSIEVNRRQAASLSCAMSFAAEIGRRPTVMVSLNLTKLDQPVTDPSGLIRRMRRDYLSRWLRGIAKKPGFGDHAPVTDAWVVENPNGHTNIHWCVRVPPAALQEFEALVVIWLARIAGAAWCDSAVHFRPITELGIAAKYMLKGTNKRYAKLLRLKVIEDQGEVQGKRCGFSENIGPAAQKRYRARHQSVATGRA